jgi:hypothetical protein
MLYDDFTHDDISIKSLFGPYPHDHGERFLFEPAPWRAVGALTDRQAPSALTLTQRYS